MRRSAHVPFPTPAGSRRNPLICCGATLLVLLTYLYAIPALLAALRTSEAASDRVHKMATIAAVVLILAVWLGLRRLSNLGTKIILTVVFFLVLPVFAFIAKVKDPLRLRFNGKSPSYWEEHQGSEDELERSYHPF